jgi:hypothetical protein
MNVRHSGQRISEEQDAKLLALLSGGPAVDLKDLVEDSDADLV